MTPPPWLKLCWRSSHYCFQSLVTAMCWALWISLGVLALTQVYIATSLHLPVPDFVLRQIETQLDEAGLQIKFGEASFDPQGHFLLRDVSFSFRSINEPAVRAKYVFVTVDPISLLLRQVVPENIRITGADLLMPAMVSPTGVAEPLLRGLDVSLRVGEPNAPLVIEHLTAHFGPLPIDLRGEWIFTASDEPSPPLDQLLQALAQNYLHGCELAREWLPRLPPVTSPHLSLVLTPHPERLANLAIEFRAGQVDLTIAQLGPVPVTIHDVQLRTELGIAGPPFLAKINISSGRLQWPTLGAVEELEAVLEALVSLPQRRFEPRLATLTAHEISTPDLTVSTPSLQTSLATLPQIQAQVFAVIAGELITAQTDIDVTTGAGRVDFDAHLDPAIIAIAGRKIDFDLPSILSWETPPSVSGTLNLGPRGKLLRAELDLETGPVIARWVPLDATSAHVTWAEEQLVAEDILLVRGRSRATGSYTMDASTLDFRFLLRGRLDPSDIDGWFLEWWPDFWRKFDFSASPPDALVDVNGCWKRKYETQTFIQADVDRPAMEGVPFDRIRTRLFVRPGWADVLEFTAERPVGVVEGSFLRQWRLPDGRRWTAVEVHASGTSDLAPAPAILGPLGSIIIAPFTMDGPLTLQLDGRVEREDFGQPIHSDFMISGETDANWSFKNFPFNGVKFSAHQVDDVLLIEQFEAGLANGVLNGRIETRGNAEASRVGFDLNLSDANLGQTLTTVTEWTASNNGETAPAVGPLQQKLASGVLNLALSAEGPADDPFGYRGSGSAQIQSDQLGEINLLGVLSTLLKRTLLNYSTLQLDSVNGNFELKGREVDFNDLKASGPRGALNATGQYYLDTQELAFVTQVKPFEASRGLLNAVLSPLSNVLEVKLGGELADPEWTFVYGPTNLLRSLTGENTSRPPSSSQSPLPPAPTTSTQPVPPQTSVPSASAPEPLPPPADSPTTKPSPPPDST